MVYHMIRYVTCLQALLDGIAVCQPQPKISPEIIKFLGKTYNAWQIAIPLLESHCVMFPQVGLVGWGGGCTHGYVMDMCTPAQYAG